jgi:hypothetical protein
MENFTILVVISGLHILRPDVVHAGVRAPRAAGLPASTSEAEYFASISDLPAGQESQVVLHITLSADLL